MEENRKIHTAKEVWDAYSDEYFAETASNEIIFHRVLKKDGRYIIFEVHPIIRPFGDDEVPVITIHKPYDDINLNDDVSKFAWRIQDIFNATFDAGFHITHMEEFHPDRNDYSLWFYKNKAQAEADNYMRFDWKQNPWAVLPQWIGFSARKEEC